MNSILRFDQSLKTRLRRSPSSTDSRQIARVLTTDLIRAEENSECTEYADWDFVASLNAIALPVCILSFRATTTLYTHQASSPLFSGHYFRLNALTVSSLWLYLEPSLSAPDGAYATWSYILSSSFLSSFWQYIYESSQKRKFENHSLRFSFLVKFV